jgi:hypothetical protein
MKVTVWHRQGLSDLAPGTHQVPADQMDMFRRGYQPGDPINAVYDYDRDTGPNLTSDDMRALAEQAFQMFNGMAVTRWEEEHADRYYAAGNRSLSVGDVVVMGEIATACESSGWAFVTIPTQTGS